MIPSNDFQTSGALSRQATTSGTGFIAGRVVGVARGLNYLKPKKTRNRAVRIP